MNIREFGVSADPSNPSEPKAPHWWVYLYVSLPSTLALAVAVYGVYRFLRWKRTWAARKGHNHEIG